MQFSGKENKVLHLGRKCQMHRYKVGSTWINSNDCDRDLDGPLLKYESELCCSFPKSQGNPGLHQERDSIKIKGSDSIALFRTGESTFGRLHPVLVITITRV